jgi:alpha-tubulin suppressor-like RCC1 family protein
MELTDYFNTIPKDAIIEIALSLDLDEIPEYCQSSQVFNQAVCNNNYFWYRKYIARYGDYVIWDNMIDWKREIYKNYYRVAIVGNYFFEILNGNREFRNFVPFDDIRAIDVAHNGGGGGIIIVNLAGDVIVMGDNVDGNLGLGKSKWIVHNPTKIPWENFGIPDIKIVQVSCGEHHTVLLDNTGRVWSMGSNRNKQLGTDDKIGRYHPTLLPNIIAKQISCGNDHTAIIDRQNNLWMMGSNKHGQLGIPDNPNRKNTMRFRGNVKYVSCGIDCTFIIDTNDNVWASGNNSYGKLGLGHNSNVPTFTQIFKPISGAPMKANMIACGKNHTAMIDLEGVVWTMGLNNMGQLGIGNNTDSHWPISTHTQAIDVSCGSSHSVIITPDHYLLGMGDDIFGQLASVGGRDPKIPTKLSDLKAQKVVCGNTSTTVILL